MYKGLLIFCGLTIETVTFRSEEKNSPASDGSPTEPTDQTPALPHPDLIRLDVSVSRISRDKTVVVTESLTRFIRNPQLYVEAAERAAVTQRL